MKEPIKIYSFTNNMYSHTIIITNFEVCGKPFFVYLEVVAEKGHIVKLPIHNLKSIIGGSEVVEIKVKLIRSENYLIPVTGEFIKRPITNQQTSTKFILELFEFIDRRCLRDNDCLDIIRLVTSGAVKIGNESVRYQAIPF